MEPHRALLEGLSSAHRDELRRLGPQLRSLLEHIGTLSK